MPFVDVKELYSRYAKGERRFIDVNLPHANLRRSSLPGVDLSGANLEGSDLREAILVGSTLSGTRLAGSDLTMTDLMYADLCGAMLAEAYLGKARLYRANLANADLSMADLSGVNLARADLSGACLVKADMVDADLNRANLSGSDLSGVELSGGKLDEAVLCGARLHDANLTRVHMSDCNLAGADLCGADLSQAILSGASLVGVRLVGSRLSGTDLSSCNLSNANLTRAQLLFTNLCQSRLNEVIVDDVHLMGVQFVSVDLTRFCSVHVEHEGPSLVDFASIALSLAAPNLESFLVNAGVRPSLARYMISCAKALDPRERFSLMLSSFISYGGPDEDFARRLNQVLKDQGVTTFFYPLDAKLGQRNASVMHRGIKEHDRVVVICSEASLTRPGVLTELTEVADEEARRGGDTCLIPIRLDDYVLSKDFMPKNPDLRDIIVTRVVGDFRGADKDSARFEAALPRLVEALRKPVEIAGVG